tara:strand:- start:107 stop:2755 length:2649 start_codon:yes stop_codon:yes gene_type:complete
MTLSHSFLVRRGNRIVPLQGSALQEGDCLPIVKTLPPCPAPCGSSSAAPCALTLGVGRLAGAVACLGTARPNETSFASTDDEWVRSVLAAVQRETSLSVQCSRHVAAGSGANISVAHGVVRGKKVAGWMARHFARPAPCEGVSNGGVGGGVPDWLVTAPEDFVRGFLQSVFDAIGTLTDAEVDGAVCLKVCFRGAPRSGRAQTRACVLCLCLARFNIVTHITATSDVVVPLHAMSGFLEAVGCTRSGRSAALRSAVKSATVGATGAVDQYEQPLPGSEGVARRARTALGTRVAACEDARTGFAAATLAQLSAWRDLLHRQGSMRHGALMDEIDQAINAHVWWDPIVDLRVVDGAAGALVYDFTVEESLQSFMLGNGVFVHNTLNTFHYAGCGSKNVTLGIPRLKELLDNSRNIRTPCKTFRLLPPFSSSLRAAEMIAKRLVQCTLRDFVRTIDVRYAPTSEADRARESSRDEDAALIDLDDTVNDPDDRQSSRWIGRITLNKRKMKDVGISPPYVHRIIEEMLGGHVHAVSSEVNCVEWVLRLRFLHVAQMMEKIPDADRDAVEEKVVIRLLSQVVDTTCVSGVQNVKAANARMVDVWCCKASRKVSVAVIDVMGGSLLDLVHVPCLDWYTSHTNDVNEAMSLLGVEAAFTVIFTELMTTLLFDGGSYINPRHGTMIVNTMTFRGFVMPLSRHGINRMDNSPLVRCSFEETIDVLFDAAMHAQRDNSEGITQNIMTGQTSFVGTGMFDVTDTLTTCSSVRKRKLMKSRVSQMGRVNVDVSLEYINPDVWSWQGPRVTNTMQTPFSSVDKDSSIAALTSSFAQPFQSPLVDTRASVQPVFVHDAPKKRFYAPTSPTVVCTKASRLDIPPRHPDTAPDPSERGF